MAKATSKESKYDLDDIKKFEEEFEKAFGKKSIKSANDYDKNIKVQRVNSLGIDKASGIGGLPFGRIVELYGWESGGKTTVCLEIIAQYLKDNPDKYSAFIDAEHSLDKNYAAKLGVDLNRLKISEPMTAEEGFDMAVKMVESGFFKVITIDSLAALIPKDVIESEMGAQKMGLQARIAAKGIEKLFALVEKHGVLLLITNQLREKIGVMFGNPETTKCGNALKFYASMRLDISRSTTAANSIVDKDAKKIGNLTKVKFIKNKLAPPFTTCEFYVRYNEGIDRIKEVITYSIDLGIIKKSGAWFSYNNTNIAQGEDALRQLFIDNNELYEEIKNKVLGFDFIEVFEPKPEELIQDEA